MAHRARFAVLFLGLCISRIALADPPPPLPSATPQQVRQSVDRAITWLQTESSTWLTQRKCAACHHAAMPLWALSEAGRMGYHIDQKFVADTFESILGSRRNMIASKIEPDPSAPPDPRPMARGVNEGAVFMAAVAGMLPELTTGQKESVAYIAADIVRKQQADGSWEFFLSRPPINENQATDVAWIIMALQAERGPDVPESHRAALAKGMAWLANTEPHDTHQISALRLLVAIRAGKPPDKLRDDLNALLAQQRPDGGWRQTDAHTASDAFATGQALYVLALGGFTAERPEIRRGIDFLVATQKPDGSWPMTSRATPDGRPGSAKLLTPITCGADSWATLALARLAPKRP
jgi:Prenyltransferase and squalene oxidase repeat